ncbi:MAG: 1,4-dihydroxy-6-naphthoate synthase [Deltaproteobacteria bacterium]|nr:MAG: 1,4-dihydroxy-6-naphthoate synthase [Deltaproteobacteria bacterium]
MTKTLSLGYSTCPNDTFIFHAMTHGRVGDDAFEFRPVLEDVETLNQKARFRTLDVTKLSFAAIGHLTESYGLLRSGAALGRGCGPLIVARSGKDLSHLDRSAVAVPGEWTTASLLLGLYLSRPPAVTAMPFDRIMPAVAGGEVDYGVIIHEGRFTFGSYGLTDLLDLGQWWEDETGLPIPLGGIAIRRDLGRSVAAVVEKIIQKSVRYAFDHPEASRNYVNAHAREMEDRVVDQHIGLYVNEDSERIGLQGQAAIEMLFKKARQAGMMPESRADLFAC